MSEHGQAFHDAEPWDGGDGPAAESGDDSDDDALSANGSGPSHGQQSEGATSGEPSASPSADSMEYEGSFDNDDEPIPDGLTEGTAGDSGGEAGPSAPPTERQFSEGFGILDAALNPGGDARADEQMIDALNTEQQQQRQTADRINAAVRNNANNGNAGGGAGHFDQDGGGGADGDGNGANQTPVDPIFNPGTGVNDTLTFQPFKYPTYTDTWYDLSRNGLSPGDMRPCRAFALQVPTAFLQRDADAFTKMEMPVNHEDRAFAYAALIGALFQPIEQGWHTGTLARDQRGQTNGAQEKRPLESFERYENVPQGEPDKTLPAFQIGYEELPDDDETELLAVRIWLFVYDPTFSITEILVEMMKFEARVSDHSSINRGGSGGSKSAASEEASKRGRGSLSLWSVGYNVSQHAALMSQFITSDSNWRTVLQYYANKTTGNPKGCPVHDDYDALNAMDASDRMMVPDPSSRYGSLSPWAPEHLLNAKRPQTLGAGLGDLATGAPLRVKYDRLDPGSYFDDDGNFRLPDSEEGGSFFWLCTDRDARSVWQLPLPRPLQGSVTPGPNLITAFNQYEYDIFKDKCKNDGSQCPSYSAWLNGNSGRDAAGRLHSLALGLDSEQLERRKRLAAQLTPYNYALKQQGYSLKAGEGNDVITKIKDADSYTIRTIPSTDTCTEQCNHMYHTIFTHWKGRAKAARLAVAKEAERAAKAARKSAEEQTKAHNDAANAHRLNTEQPEGYNIRKEAFQYSARQLEGRFRSIKDRLSIPPGYQAMYDGLMAQVAKNGGTASMAYSFSEGEASAASAAAPAAPADDANGEVSAERVRQIAAEMMYQRQKALPAKDRTVWGCLQEWLGAIFVDDCMIAGRDRGLMDHLYVHCFEPYTKNSRFILFFLAPRGTGKSKRVERMMAIMPKGWILKNGGSSAKAGMNGNHSPSNGCVVFYDEVDTDLTWATCDKRMEYWKQKLSSQSFEMERTVQISDNVHGDSHVTVRIVTDHRESDVCCSNMGQLFTKDNLRPDEGKYALCQRTVSHFARTQTKAESSDSAFEAQMAKTPVRKRIADFRLFTCLVGFVRLLLRNCDWLKPNLKFADDLWREFDKILTHEDGLCESEARRNIRRSETLITLCVMEAVARVFLFRQTAWYYEYGKPDPNTGTGQKFEVGMLWDVVRTLHPTRELILYAWSLSLENNIGTCRHGVAVMTAACAQAGLTIDGVLRRLPKESPESMLQAPNRNLPGGASADEWALPPTLETDVGAKQGDIDELHDAMHTSRKRRSVFRRLVYKDSGGTDRRQAAPLEEIRAAHQRHYDRTDPSQGLGPMTTVKDALFPTLTLAACFYKEQSLLHWATGRTSGVDSTSGYGRAEEVIEVDKFSGCKKTVQFLELPDEAANGAKLYDFAWLALYKPPRARPAAFGPGGPGGAGGSSGFNGTSPIVMVGRKLADDGYCSSFDMHEPGVIDALRVLATKENDRYCPQMPRMKEWQHSQENAIRRHMRPRPQGDDDGGDGDTGESAQGLSLNGFQVQLNSEAKYIGAHEDVNELGRTERAAMPFVCQAHGTRGMFGTVRVPFHKPLDRMYARCRLPALLPHTSTAVSKSTARCFSTPWSRPSTCSWSWRASCSARRSRGARGCTSTLSTGRPCPTA
jgi:hypothetical protein